MKLISLNIHFDQINAFTWCEVIVQCYGVDFDDQARVFAGRIRPVIDI